MGRSVSITLSIIIGANIGAYTHTQAMNKAQDHTATDITFSIIGANIDTYTSNEQGTRPHSNRQSYIPGCTPEPANALSCSMSIKSCIWQNA